MEKLQNPYENENMELFSGQFEGDMVLNLRQWASIDGIIPKTGLINQTYRWINNTVPYELSNVFGKLNSMIITAILIIKYILINLIIVQTLIFFA